MDTDYQQLENIYSCVEVYTYSGIDTKELRLNFDKSIKYDASKNRITSLLIDPTEGFTVEFWLKKNSFLTASTNKESYTRSLEQ